MKSWNDYKKTYRSESDIFDFARSGDLRGLITLLSENLALDLDAKNQRGYSALMLAVYNSEKDFCEALLRSGADVNSSDGVGNTVLMAAAFKGELNIMTLLLQFGALNSPRNQSNMNARDWASMFGRTEAVVYLDNVFPHDGVTSKSKNVLRFIRLGFMMIRTKMKTS